MEKAEKAIDGFPVKKKAGRPKKVETASTKDLSPNEMVKAAVVECVEPVKTENMAVGKSISPESRYRRVGALELPEAALDRQHFVYRWGDPHDDNMEMRRANGWITDTKVAGRLRAMGIRVSSEGATPDGNIVRRKGMILICMGIEEKKARDAYFSRLTKQRTGSEKSDSGSSPSNFVKHLNG